MQDVVSMHILDRVQQFQQHFLDVRGRQAAAILLDDVQKIPALDEIERHVGGAAILEHLVDADDVGMVQRRHAPRLEAEMFDDLFEILLQCTRPCPHVLAGSQAHRVRKAFLDDHLAVQAVPRQIGDAEAAGIQMAVDLVLAPQQAVAGSQGVVAFFAMGRYVVVSCNGHDRLFTNYLFRIAGFCSGYSLKQKQ